MIKNISLRKRKRSIILLSLILILGFTLRIYHITTLPAGFHADEASIAYNAYTILTHGTDEYGTPFPVFFKAFGEYKSPIQIYTTVPFIFLFGLNEFSARLPSALYGTLTILTIYFLVKELFPYHVIPASPESPRAESDNFENKSRLSSHNSPSNQHSSKRSWTSQDDKRINHLLEIRNLPVPEWVKLDIPIIATALLAISPWHIHFSRVAYEQMPFVFFTTLGLLIFLKSKTRPNLLPLAITAFALALYSYFSGRIFIPLFGIGLFLLNYRFFLKHKKQTIISLLLLCLLLIPFITSLTSQEGIARWKRVSVFDYPPKNQTIPQHIAINYLRHFSPEFLFLKGDIDMPGQQVLRDSVRGIGELYLFQLPLILLGLYTLIKTKHKTLPLLLLWLALYPTGSMFTLSESPWARRSIIGVIPFQILSAVGTIYLIQLITKMKKKASLLSLTTISCIVLLSFIHYLYLYFITYPQYSSAWWGWQYGPKQIISYFTSHEKNYDDLIMAPYFNSPWEFFKFYAPTDCQKCQYGLPENFYTPTRKQLYALPPDYLTTHPNLKFTPKKNILYPNGQPAFLLTEIKK